MSNRLSSALSYSLEGAWLIGASSVQYTISYLYVIHYTWLRICFALNHYYTSVNCISLKSKLQTIICIT